MPTAEKQAILNEITENLKNSNGVYITKFTGMTVADSNELRGEFRKGNVFYKVYKNKLMKLVMEDLGGYDDIIPSLKDQNAFVFVDEEISAPAKILKEFTKKYKKPEFKGALIDGEYYGPDRLEALASMKSKDEIIGDIIGLLLSPATNVVGALTAQGSNIVGALKTIAEKGE